MKVHAGAETVVAETAPGSGAFDMACSSWEDTADKVEPFAPAFAGDTDTIVGDVAVENAGYEACVDMNFDSRDKSAVGVRIAQKAGMAYQVDAVHYEAEWPAVPAAALEVEHSSPWRGHYGSLLQDGQPRLPGCSVEYQRMQQNEVFFRWHLNETHD